MRRVVVTGLAPVSIHGIGKKAFFDSLMQKTMILSEVPPEYEVSYKFKSRCFVPAPAVDLENSTLMEEMSKLAVVSAKLAVEDAKLQACEHCGVMMGVGISGLKTGFESYEAHISAKGRFNRMCIPMLMPNAAAAWIAITLGAQGLCHTVNAACSSGAVAVGEGFLHIKNGTADCILAGGCEALDDGIGAIMRGFDMLTTLTLSQDGKPNPFSENRSGFLFNMGASCTLVLEELEHAKRRGADIYAEIVDYRANCDAYNIVQMQTDGHKIRELFEAVKDINVDYINAHGTGTMLNDKIESSVFLDVFGANQPLVNSTKGIIGHTIGASGAIEAATTAYSIKNGMVHGNVTNNVLPNLNLPMDTVAWDIENAISVSYGFGGHNTLLLMRKYHG